MSTYNGCKYLPQQLDSIFSQEGVNIRLIVRDDCSTDRTVELLEKYIENGFNILIEKGTENLGPSQSFLYLIRKYTDDNYFALSDQDDIWDNNKLIIAIKKIQKQNNNKPILYYSNLKIVNENGDFCRFSHTSPHVSESTYSALIENLATGCTIVYNKRLAEIASKIKPVDYSMHDAWLYTVTKFFGTTIYDYEPHINYRQHGDNQIGTYKRKLDLKKINQEWKVISGKNGKTWSNNAKIFLNQFKEFLPSKKQNEIEKLIMYNKNLKNKLAVIFNPKYYPSNNYRKIRFIIEVLFNTL